MSYVKNYDVGQIKLDLPYANYIHELPLLSFGDVRGGVNLSLVYNSANFGENTFSIANGFKLNMQKRIIIKTNSTVPEKLQDESGKYIQLINNNGIYTFDDDSQRILRVTSGGYEVEYPDFSKEIYNANGNIIEVYDKYGVESVLVYTYDTDNKLTKITYRGSKEIELSYSTNKLSSICYDGDSTNFTCGSDSIEIARKSNAICTINYNSDEYKLNQGDSEECLLCVERDSNNKKITVTDRYTNSTVYKFDNSAGANEINQMVDIINKNGVQTRIQFEGKKMLYSYEVNDGEPMFYSDTAEGKFLGNVILHNTQGVPYNNKAVGMQTINDGVSMIYNENLYEWETNVTQNAGKSGYYILSGWIKSNKSTISGDTIHIKNSSSNTIYSFYVDLQPTGKWKYFSVMFYMSANTLYVHSDYGSSGTSTRDLRITFQETGVLNSADVSHTNISKSVLIIGGDTISFNDARFFYSTSNGNIEIESDESADRTVTFSDVMRYKLRKKKYGVSNEIYFNNGKNVLTGVTDLKVLHNGAYVSISNFDLGVELYSGEKTSLTRINVDENDQNSNIVKTYAVDETVVATEALNNNLDVIETTSESVKVSYKYETSSCGLISEQTTSPMTGATDADTIVKQYNYDTGLTKLLSTVDEFGKTTYYTTNDVWGTVTEVTLPDGTVITDSHDSSMSELNQRTFDDASGSRSTSFGYFEGNLSSLGHGYLDYDFKYTKLGELEIVCKQDESVEQYSYEYKDGTTDVTVTYPLHTETTVYDKYGRLTSIDGVLENKYRVWPSFYDTGEIYDETDNGSSYLAMSIDKTRAETSRYKYNENGLVIEKTVTNSEDFTDKISEENFEYDGDNRLTSDECKYNLITDKRVKSVLTYDDFDTENTKSDRIKTYSYEVNGTEKAKTVNEYEAYKRLNKKTYTVGGRQFIRSINYDRTRVESVEESIGKTTLYEYDAMGRISKEKSENGAVLKSYVYDSYGQLIEEDDNTLDKSIQYEYNENGNIERVNDDGTVKDFIYDETYPDRLISYNGKAITYANNGGVASYNGWNYTWSKGKLANISTGTIKTGIRNYGFQYNALGQRVGRSYSRGVSTSGINPVITGEVTNYTKTFYYDNAGRLVSETISNTCYGIGLTSEEIVYLYDDGSIIGMQYTALGETNIYYFARNLQGDVIGIYDTNGTQIADYAYDAYGNCTITSDTTDYAVAYANPIRYRGYYYDMDTGLYYLNSRYYSPEFRRFISPDDTAYLDPKTPNGLNLYCYCNNDPVNFVDPSGHLAITTIFIGCLAAFAVGSTVSAISQGFQYGWDNISLGQVLIDGAFASISVALAATGLHLMSSIGIGAAMGFGQYAISSELHNDTMTIQGAIIATLLGGIGGAISGDGANNLRTLSTIYDDMTGRAAQGVKALITAANRYGFGSKQYALVNNLYGRAIKSVVDQGIHNAFIISRNKVITTTIFTPGFGWLLNEIVSA